MIFTVIPTCAEADSEFGDSQERANQNQWLRVIEGVVMGKAIVLRADFDGRQLRQLARRTKNANQGRRLLALAEIYDGGSRSRAARVGGVGRRIVRDWVERFNARGSEGLIDGKAPGNKAQAQRCAAPGAGGDHRKGPDAGTSRGHTLAAGRPCQMAGSSV
jgi:hypothetical protein